MKAAQLRQEYAAAVAGVRQPHLDLLVALGVSASTIARWPGGYAPFGIAPIKRAEDGLYEPGAGDTYVMMPVVEQGFILDIVAWRSNAPRDWALRCGAGWALGADLLLSHWDDTPLNVVATPLDWFKAGGAALCVLDWGATEIDRICGVAAIHAEPPMADRLTHVLSRPRPLPMVVKAVACAD